MSESMEVQEEVRTERTQMVSHGPAYLFGRPLGEILVSQFQLPREKLDEALAAQAEKGGRIGEVLVGMKAATEEQVARALAAQLDLEYVATISTDEVQPDLIQKVAIGFAKAMRMLPLKQSGEVVKVAVADPLDTAMLDHARMMFGSDIEPVMAQPSTIVDAINAVYDRNINEAEQVVGEMEADIDAAEKGLEEAKDLLDSGDEAPIIRLVNSLLFRAAKERASDIHIEPMDRELVVRFRVDGQRWPAELSHGKTAAHFILAPIPAHASPIELLIEQPYAVPASVISAGSPDRRRLGTALINLRCDAA